MTPIYVTNSQKRQLVDLKETFKTVKTALNVIFKILHSSRINIVSALTRKIFEKAKDFFVIPGYGGLQYLKAASQRYTVQNVFCKKRCFLKISQISQENICSKVSFLIKLQASGWGSALVFSFEFCEIFKNTFSYRTPPVAPSVYSE